MKLIVRFCFASLLLFALFLAGLHWSAQVQAAEDATNAYGAVLYRVNAGGPQTPAADGSTPDWSADLFAAPSPYVAFPISDARIFSTTKNVTLDPSVPPAAPMSLFQIERWDTGIAGQSLTSEMKWSFPVTHGKQIEIRLYLAEIYSNVSTIGQRIFDVEVDGVVPPVYDNIDVMAVAGGKYIGVMKPYVISSDGIVNLNFRHIVEHPAIKAIEIVEFVNSPPIVTNPFVDLTLVQGNPVAPIQLAGVFSDAEHAAGLTYSIVNNSNGGLVTPVINEQALNLTLAANLTGTASLTVRATDPVGEFVEDTFTVTVVSKLTLAAIGNQSLDEGAILNIPMTAADPSPGVVTLAATGVPAGALFTDNGDRTGRLVWATDFKAAGIYTITVTASNTFGQSAAETFRITVNNVNQPPVIGALSNPTIVKGAPLTLTLTATDADGDPLLLTVSGLPNGAAFKNNGNGTGVLTWTPTTNDAGSYNITVTVRDSGNMTDQQSFTIKVVDAIVNVAPILTAINNQSVNEGATLAVAIVANDPNNDAITLTATGVPTGATFVDNHNGTGGLNWSTDFDDAGVYTVTVSAKDPSGLTDAKQFKITVNNINRKPTVSATGAQTIKEGEKLTLTVTASDPDGEKVTLTATGVPTGATFVDHQNGTGTLTWNTKAGDAGVYTVTVTATDAANGVMTQPLTITVSAQPGGTGQDKKLFIPLMRK